MDRVKPFRPAFLLICFVLCAAPFLGALRREMFDAFPVAAVAALFLFLALPAVGLVVYAILGIRSQRGWRYGGLILAAGFVWLQLTLTLGDGDVSVSLIERTHIVIYGFLSWLFYRAFRLETEDISLVLLPLLLTTAVGALDEGVQFLASTRLGDYRDIQLDALAGISGVLVGLSLDPPKTFRWRPAKWQRLSDGLALTLLTVGLFFYHAHLGTLIHDPEIGRFRSWSTQEELLAAGEVRARRWALHPPKISPWTLEDLFITEAGWYANHRDACYSRRKFSWARQSNLILEKYYAPYLDLENFHGKHRRRYGPQVLRELESHPVDPQTYVSPVLARRIFLWPPKHLFLAGLLSVVGILCLGPRLPRMRGAASSGE